MKIGRRSRKFYFEIMDVAILLVLWTVVCWFILPLVIK